MTEFVFLFLDAIEIRDATEAEQRAMLAAYAPSPPRGPPPAVPGVRMGDNVDRLQCVLPAGPGPIRATLCRNSSAPNPPRAGRDGANSCQGARPREALPHGVAAFRHRWFGTKRLGFLWTTSRSDRDVQVDENTV